MHRQLWFVSTQNAIHIEQMDVKIIDISKGEVMGMRDEGMGWSGRLCIAASIQWTRECIAHDPVEFSAKDNDSCNCDTDYHFNLGSTSHLLHSRSDAERRDERRKQWNCSFHLEEGADGRRWWQLASHRERWNKIRRRILNPCLAWWCTDRGTDKQPRSRNCMEMASCANWREKGSNLLRVSDPMAIQLCRYPQWNA